MHDFEDAVILQKEENQSEILVTEARLCRAKTGNMQLYIELPCNRKICSLQHYANVNNNNNNNKTNKQTNKTTMKKNNKNNNTCHIYCCYRCLFCCRFCFCSNLVKKCKFIKSYFKSSEQ